MEFIESTTVVTGDNGRKGLFGDGLAESDAQKLTDATSDIVDVVKRNGGFRKIEMTLLAGFDEPSDDRPSIAGHPLPWSIVQVPPLPPKRSDDISIPEAAHAYVVDGDGYQILRFYTEQPEGRLLKALVEHLAKPRETLADLTLAEKSAKVNKLRLENERACGVEGRRIAALEDALVKLARTYLPKSPYEMNDCDRKARNVLTELGLGTLIWTPEASS